MTKLIAVPVQIQIKRRLDLLPYAANLRSSARNHPSERTSDRGSILSEDRLPQWGYSSSRTLLAKYWLRWLSFFVMIIIPFPVPSDIEEPQTVGVNVKFTQLRALFKTGDDVLVCDKWVPAQLIPLVESNVQIGAFG